MPLSPLAIQNRFISWKAASPEAVHKMSGGASVDENDQASIELIDLCSPSKPDELPRPEKEYPEIEAFVREFDYNVNRCVIEFGCKFYVPPEVQAYRYTPAPSELDKVGEPLLLGSPTFDGPGNTKWQITTCFNRWVGTERWLPLYLTRDDKDWSVNATNMKLQCELRIVDKDRKVLKSTKSKMISVRVGTSQGVTKFLPFQRIGEMLTKKNFLLIEAHLTFLLVNDDKATEVGSASSSKTDFKKSQAFLDLKKKWKDEDERIISHSGCPVPFDEGEFVEEDDRVELICNGQRVGFLSRKAFKEKSGSYLERLKEDPSSSTSIYFGHHTEGERPRHDITVLKSFLMFINHGGPCHVLLYGTFEDKVQLFHLADIWFMPELMRECLKFMTLNLNPENAAFLANLFKEFFSMVDVDRASFERFRKFYRKNLKEIQKTDTFMVLMQHTNDRTFYTRLAFDPVLYASLKNVRLSGSDYDF